MTSVSDHFEPASDDQMLTLEVATAGAHRDGGRVVPCRVLRVRGEVDAVTAHHLTAAVDGELHTLVSLVLDLTAMTFCGAVGLAAIASGAARAGERQVSYAVAGLAPRLARLCAELWPAPHPDHYPNLEAALIALAARGDGWSELRTA